MTNQAGIVFTVALIVLSITLLARVWISNHPKAKRIRRIFFTEEIPKRREMINTFDKTFNDKYGTNF